MVAPGSEMAQRQGVLGLNHSNTWKNIQKYFSSKPYGSGAWNLVYSMAKGPIPCLRKWRSQGQKWSYARGAGLEP